MFEVMRCGTCGKLRMWTDDSFRKVGFPCQKCGGGLFRPPMKYSTIEKMKLGWWCLRENWAEGRVSSIGDVVACIRMGLNARTAK